MNNEDTISRAYMVQRFENYRRDCEDAEDEHAAQVFADCVDELMDAPSVPPKVVHGRWVNNYYGVPCCSECLSNALLDGAEDYVKSKFCHNCGAKIDGGNDDADN